MSTLATHTALSVWSAVSAFLVLLILTGLFFLAARTLGRGRFAALLLALYAGYALYSTFAYASFLPTAPPVTALLAHALLYGAFVMAFYLILRRMVVSDFLHISLLGFAVLAFAGAAFLMALAYHVLAVNDVYRFTPAIQALFAPKAYFFWWFSAPAIGLFLFAR